MIDERSLETDFHTQHQVVFLHRFAVLDIKRQPTHTMTSLLALELSHSKF